MAITSNVSQFLQTVGQGVRPNLFLASFIVPKIPGLVSASTGTASSASRNLVFTAGGGGPDLVVDPNGLSTISTLCKSAALPSSNLGVIDVPFRGRTVKVVGDRTFDTWTATFINDSNFYIRNVMERWLSAMNTHVANTADLWTPVDGPAPIGTNSSNPNQKNNLGYTANITIQQLQRDNTVDGSPLRTYTLFSCFPTNVSQIDLAYDSNDQIEDFTVEFQVQYWQATAGGLPGQQSGSGNQNTQASIATIA
jgi:hypothetical protein